MTPESQRIAIAEACGVADKFVLLKRGLYWRPSGHGYTSNINEAWILTEAEADKYVYPHDEPVTKTRAPLPNYLNDLNAMHEAEKVLNEDQARLFNDLLFDSKDVSKLDGSVNDYVWHAEASHRAEVFLVTLGLWKD